MAKKEKKTSAHSGGGSEIAQKFKQNPGLYIGSVVILILITVVFLGGDLLSPGGSNWENTFGYYDKAPIMFVQGNVFHQDITGRMQYYQSMGMDMSNQWMAAQIWRQSFEAATEHVAILRLMQRSNYEVPKRSVDRRVASLPDFQVNGRFSASLYNQMSESARLALWRRVQEDMIKNVFINDVTDSLLMTHAEADFIGSLAGPERTFDLVAFNVDDYPESEYTAYAEANSHLFDSIHLSKITVTASEREARKILDQINSGVISFEDAARAHSQDHLADRGGDMGSRFNFDLISEIPSLEDRNSIFNLKNGELSSIIKIDDSWVIFRVEETLTKADFNDETVMERVRSYVRNIDRGRMEDWAIDRANEFISDIRERGNSFVSAANSRGLDVNSFGPLPINYGSVDLFSGLHTNPIQGISEQDARNLPENENFWKTAFSIEVNSPSLPFVQGNNVIVLYPTDEIDVSDTKAPDAASKYLSYWMNDVIRQSIQPYFINNPRMDDRFWSVYQF